MKNLLLKGLSIVALSIFLASVASAQSIEKQTKRGVVDYERKICVAYSTEKLAAKKTTTPVPSQKNHKRVEATRKAAGIKEQL